MTERRIVLSAAAAGLAMAASSPASGQTATARPLAGKVALVTGAARGIGRATAVELAGRGADVALLDIAHPDAIPVLRYRLGSRAELERTAELVQAEQVRALPLVADLRDLAAMRDAAQRVVAMWGGIDILVCNAAIAIDGRLGEMQPAAWQALVDVNFTGTMHTIWAALPGLRRPGGRVIVVTSIQGRRGSAESGAYAATKWGLTGLMKSLALELGPEGIAVTAVAPTAVETPMLRRNSSGRPPGDPREAAQRMHHALPVGALQPRDIAAAIAFLAGPEAQHVSGATLDVNAGRSAEFTA